ncbi:MAG: hypothetical protein ACP5KN_05535 [Armatimonadota bacterium]
MENLRIYMTTDVPEAALAELDKLDGITAGDGVILAAGEARPEEDAMLVFYQAEGGKGEIRIPFSSIAMADEGVRRATMKRTTGLAG